MVGELKMSSSNLRLTREWMAEKVPQWLLEGKTIDEMAELFGCTHSTLVVKASQFKISLRKSFYTRGGKCEPLQSLELLILESKFRRLEKKAEQCGLSAKALVGRLLVTIIDDDLFQAVLDD